MVDRIAEELEEFEGYVTNTAETIEIRDHVYQLIIGFIDEQLARIRSGKAEA